MSKVIVGTRIPDSALVRDIDEPVRGVASDQLYHHARGVFLFATLTGLRRELIADPELLYLAALDYDDQAAELLRAQKAELPARRSIRVPAHPAAVAGVNRQRPPVGAGTPCDWGD